MQKNYAYLLALMFSLLIFTGCANKTNEEKVEKKVGATFWGASGDQEETFKQLIKDVDGIGFRLSDPHARVNDGYKEKYGSTTLDNLGFFSITNNDTVRELLEKHPSLGGFSPFNMHIYKLKDENTTWVGHVDPNVMADIVGLNDPKLRKTFIDSFKPLDKVMQKTMQTTKTDTVMFTSLPEEPMMKYEVDVKLDPEEDPEDALITFIEEFQEQFEEAFEDNEYIIAGYKNFKEIYSDNEQEFAFDAYWVYSLCHFKFSNDIFNDVPKAGAFAPCSLYMYIKEGSNKLEIGMPKLANWAAVLGIKDEAKLKLINDLDAEIISIFKSIGAKYLGKENGGAVAVTSVDKKDKEVSTVREKVTLEDGQSPTYLVADYMDKDAAIKVLKDSGMQILAEYNVDKKGDLVSIVFTHQSLKDMAKKSDRGFIGVAKLYINNINKEIRFTNVRYFAKAFMQDDLEQGACKPVMMMIKTKFSNVGPSADHYEYDDLDGYHFMIGMPYYKEMITLAEGDTNELYNKVKGSSVFSLDLGGKYLVGLEIGSKTKKFVKKVGIKNGGLLPYMVMIEDGKAKILDPKYYLAISYPQLTMGEFTTIATVPGAIEEDLKKYFK